MSMGKRALLALALLVTAACTAPEESHSKAILGAVLIDGFGGPPLTNSIVLMAGDRIRGAGPLSTIPIPAQADKINGGGRFLMPGLVNVAANIQGRDEAAFAKAREAGAPAIGRVTTLSDAQWMLDHGATGFVGMIRDTEALDPDLLAKLRDLRITVAPALSMAGAGLEIAKRNTLRLFQAGVPIALASDGANPLREAELLVEAGIPPLDVIVAATRNGAAALHDADTGAIQPGKRANLLLLSANPGEDIRNLARVEMRIVNGEIVSSPR
jgi:imidazolonepropionase-like amidohydrolase